MSDVLCVYAMDSMSDLMFAQSLWPAINMIYAERL